jgi:hypothetical protein
VREPGDVLLNHVQLEEIFAGLGGRRDRERQGDLFGGLEVTGR